MKTLHDLFAASPETALFLTLATGYIVGKLKLKIGSFQLGGVAGSLLTAVIIGQVGVDLSANLRNILFALFIYAVGYECGPQFFRSLNRKSVKEVFMAAGMAVIALLMVLGMAKATGLNKGLAAGVAAGAMTQSAVMGTAEDAYRHLASTTAAPNQAGEKSPAASPVPAPKVIEQFESDVAVGYAVTYIFGSFGAIIVCCHILPWFMRRGIREDSLAEEMRREAGQTVLGENEELAAHPVTGRVYKLDSEGLSVAKLEEGVSAVVERVERKGVLLPLAPDLALEAGNAILMVGHPDDVLKAMQEKGTEIKGNTDMQFKMLRKNVIVTSESIAGLTLDEIKAKVNERVRHGVFLVDLLRDGSRVALDDSTRIEKGDAVTLYGSESDIGRVAPLIGYTLTPGSKTDFVYMGLGLAVGLLLGLLVVPVLGISLTLGAGGGALLSGLIFGWFHGKHQRIGAMPPGAVALLKDLGLAGFVAIIGLTTGKQAIQTFETHGLTLFLVGVVVTLVPLLAMMVFGKYVLRYDNAAIMASSLAGSRSASPAFGQMLKMAGNSVPTVPFAVTYALANVFLTLLGPLVVALV